MTMTRTNTNTNTKTKTQAKTNTKIKLSEDDDDEVEEGKADKRGEGWMGGWTSEDTLGWQPGLQGLHIDDRHNPFNIHHITICIMIKTILVTLIIIFFC